MNRHRTGESVCSAVYLSLLALALGSAASAATAEDKNLDRTFTVAPGGVLTVNADGAEVFVSGSDANTVVVRIQARGPRKELDELHLSAQPGSDGVTVEALRPKQRGWGSWHVDTHIDVTVPRSYRVNASTTGGDVRLQSVAGPSRLHTSGGNLSARDVKGDFEGHTSGGQVRIESMEGSVNAHTSGGSMFLSDIKGDVDADTSGGDVRVVKVDGKIRAGTGGGSVRCELTGPNRGVSATTSGGSVWLTLPKDVTATVDAKSSGGEIESDFPISTTRWSEHRLSGTINGGGNEIYVRTSGGNITLNTAR
jgi:hypothetical protein